MLGSGFNEMAGTIQVQEARAEQLYAELEAKDALRRQLLGRLIDGPRRGAPLPRPRAPRRAGPAADGPEPHI